MFDIVVIISKIRSALGRRDILIILGLVLLFFALRLYRLADFPIFSDEGIYIRWARVAWADASWRFISLTDGRQPLQTWLTIPFLKLFPEQALLAGRLFSVTTGFAATAGMFSLLWYLFGKKASYLGTFIYILIPSFLFYDRMALVDSAVNASVIWIILFSIILARTIRLDVALILGGIFGFSLLAKSSVKLYMTLASLSSVFLIVKENQTFRDFFSLSFIRHKKIPFFSDRETLLKIVNFNILFGISIFVSYIIYNVQRLSPFFHYVAEKNKTFVLTGSELLQDPFSLLLANLPKIPYYLFSEMGWVIPILGLFGLIFLYRKNKPLSIYLTLFFLMSYLLIGGVAKVLFPRYLLPLGSVLFIPVVYLLSTLKKQQRLIALFVVAISIIYFDYTILFNYPKIPFPAVDRGQYIEGVTAVWGAEELVEFARSQSQTRSVVLLAEGNFGLIGDVLETFKNPEDNIEIKGYWPLELPQLQENQFLLKDKTVYAVFSHRSEFPPDWPIKLVKKYEKPLGTEAVYLYELQAN